MKDELPLVFISYSHKNSEIAAELAAILDALDITYFHDIKGISVGDSIPETVNESLADCAAIIPIISNESAGSHWVPFEIGYAKAWNKLVFPLVTVTSEEVHRYGYISNLRYASSIEEMKERLITAFVTRSRRREDLQKPTERVAQSITFSESCIDDEFWVRHYSKVTHDGKLESLERYKYVVNAKRTNTLVLEPEHNYDLMSFLNRDTGELYYATANAEELRWRQTHPYIYDLTSRFAHKIRRVFILPDISALTDLDESNKERLREQIEKHCELRYYIGDPSLVPNVAIYGNLAVGLLNDNRSNVVHFNPEKIKIEKDRYNSLWLSVEKNLVGDVIKRENKK